MPIGQLIYNIAPYSSEHNRFVAYIGVDASRPDVASIKIKVSVSDDGKTWSDVVPQTDVYYS